MNKFTCDIEPFKKYIHDSSAAIFSEESNKAHDWRRKITCYVGKNEHVLNIHPVECYGNGGKFYFFLELELLKDATKTEAKELLCHVADEMQFHPNIRVLDRTEHSEAIGYHATREEPTGDDRYFWLHPKGFKFEKDELGRYCWDEISESPSAYPWEAAMLVEVKTTPVASDGWGSSFDLSPDPVSLLRTAIRERDEKIAAEEARKRAEEEAEEARLTAEEERVRLENEQNFQDWEHVKKFVDEIGDFEVKVPSKEGDGNFTYMPIRQVICFEWTHGGSDPNLGDPPPPTVCRWRPGMELEYWVSFGYHMNFDCDDSTSLNINRHGYNEAIKIIIDWAVHYGAREPEASLAG